MTPLPRWLSIALMLAIAVIFGSNHVSARVALDHGTSVITAVSVRSIATAVVVFGLLVMLKAPLALSRRQLWLAAGVGALLALQSWFLYSAVARLPVALALLAFNLHPMIYALMTAATGKERVPARAALAMPAALVGLALALDVVGKLDTMAARWSEIGAGVAFAIGAAVTFAMVVFLSARWLGSVDGRLRSGITSIICGVVAVAAGFATDSHSLPADATGWTGLALLSIFYGTALTSFFVILPRLRSATDTVTFNFEPISVLFLGWIILGQAVGPTQIAGALIVIGAIVAMGLAKR